MEDSTFTLCRIVKNRIGLDIRCGTATPWNTSIHYFTGHFARATGTSAHPPDAAPHLGQADL